MSWAQPTIESLKTKIESTKNQLDDFKQKIKNFSPEEKTEKAKTLSDVNNMQEAQEIKQALAEIKAELDALKASATATPAEMNDVETQLKSINDDYDNTIKEFDDELKTLQSAVTWISAPKQWWDWWLSKQRKWLLSWQEWKDNTKTNVLRALWWVWIIWWIAWLWDKIFNRIDYEEEIPWYKNMTKSEKKKARKKYRRELKKEKKHAESLKSFWDRPFWKFLKWTGIWTGVYYVVHGLATWQWHPTELFNWEKDEKIQTPEQQVADYEALTQEQREVYEKIWHNVNTFYWKVWDQEKKIWFVDENYLWTISEKVKSANGQEIKKYEWLVPFCIDISTDTVERILSEHEIESLCFNSDKEKLWNEVKTWWKDKLAKVLWKFIPSLASFKWMWWNSLGDKLKNRVDASDEYSEQRKDELQYFFRQYLKVLVYLNDKKTELEYKLTEEEVKFHWYTVDGETSSWQSNDPDGNNKLIIDAMNDGDWFDAHIKDNEKYKKFMSWRLFDIDNNLKEFGLNNGEVSKYLQEEVLDDLDDKEQDILDIDENDIQDAWTTWTTWTIKTMLDKWIEELESWWSLSHKGRLSRMCEDLCDDIEDEFAQGWLHKYFEWVSVATNTEDAAMEQFLEHTWMKDAVDGYQNIIKTIKTKIDNGTVTKEELQQLKDSTAEWFALKKEIAIAIYTMQDIKSDNPDLLARLIKAGWALIKNTFNALKDIFTGNGDFHDYLIALWGIATIAIVTHPGKTVGIVRRAWVTTVEKTAKCTSYIVWRWITTPYMSTRWLQRRMKSISSLANKKSYFLYFVTGWWSRDENRLLRIARENFSQEYHTVWEVLQDIIGTKWMNGVSWADLWRCLQDKNLAKLAVTHTASSNVRRYRRIRQIRQTREFTVNKKNVQYITEALNEIAACNNTETKKLLKSMLCSVKTAEELEFCHDLAYWVHGWEVPEAMIKSLGRVRRSHMKWLTSSAYRSQPRKIYEHISLKKFSWWNADKEALLRVVLGEQSSMGGFSSTAAKNAVKEFEWVKHTIKNLNSEQVKAMKEIFQTSGTFDPKIVSALLKNGWATLENIIKEIGKLNSSDKTRQKIWQIIINQAGNSNPELKALWQRLVNFSHAHIQVESFVKILSKVKKAVTIISKL